MSGGQSMIMESLIERINVLSMEIYCLPHKQQSIGFESCSVQCFQDISFTGAQYHTLSLISG